LHANRKSQIKSLKTRIANSPEKRFLIFVDEAHYGQALESQFAQFKKYCENSGNVSFFYITATPSPFFGGRTRLSEIRKQFNLFYLKPPPSYYSLQECFNDSRIIDIPSRLRFDKKTNYNDWIEEVIVQKLIVQNENRKGFFMVRTPKSKTAEKLKNEIAKKADSIFKKYNVTVESHIYDSTDKHLAIKEISAKLDGYCEQGPNRIDVLIVCQALGMGKTIELGGLIGWFDYLNQSSQKNKYDNEARLVQSLGRNLGNNVTNRRYPIWTSLKVVDAVLMQFQEMSIIGNSKTNNSRLLEHINRQTSTHVSGNVAKIQESLGKHWVFKDKVELDDWLKQNEVYSSYTLKDSQNNNINDLCGIILGTARHTSFKCGLEADGYWVAKFSGLNANHTKSWNDLMQKNPQFKGKIVLYKIIKQHVVSDSKNHSVHAAK